VVLGRLGYRRTKMSDVSAEAGLSSGAIYTYVESKEALLHVVLADFFGHFAGGTPPLPIAAPPIDETLDLVADGLRREAATPLLRTALESLQAGDEAQRSDDSTSNRREDSAHVMNELAGIVDEHYSLVDRLWPILAVIEKCSADIPELYRFYFGRRRRAQLDHFAQYLALRAERGQVRVLGDAALTAQLAIEAVTWHAWHRLEGFDAERFAGDHARPAVIEFVCTALRP
jgi:AcrR family transcriptional regulator